MEIELRDYAMPSEVMCGIVGGYIEEVVRLNGHAGVTREKTDCRLRGAETCRWRFRFEPGS
jgi:predicted hydrocarbon binding protein